MRKMVAVVMVAVFAAALMTAPTAIAAENWNCNTATNKVNVDNGGGGWFVGIVADGTREFGRAAKWPVWIVSTGFSIPGRVIASLNPDYKREERREAEAERHEAATNLAVEKKLAQDCEAYALAKAKNDAEINLANAQAENLRAQTSAIKTGATAQGVQPTAPTPTPIVVALTPVVVTAAQPPAPQPKVLVLEWTWVYGNK